MLKNIVFHIRILLKFRFLCHSLLFTLRVSLEGGFDCFYGFAFILGHEFAMENIGVGVKRECFGFIFPEYRNRCWSIRQIMDVCLVWFLTWKAIFTFRESLIAHSSTKPKLLKTTNSFIFGWLNPHLFTLGLLSFRYWSWVNYLFYPLRFEEIHLNKGIVLSQNNLFFQGIYSFSVCLSLFSSKVF